MVRLDAQPTMTALGLTGYVTLRSAGQANVVAVSGDADSEFIFTLASGVNDAPVGASQNVTLRQAVSTTMLGDVYSYVDTNLTLVGAGRASFLNPFFANNFPGSGAFGFNNTLTVGTVAEAGHVEILAAFGGESIALAQRSATIADQGSIAVRANGGSLASPEVFNGTVTGVANAGRFIKTGRATWMVVPPASPRPSSPPTRSRPGISSSRLPAAASSATARSPSRVASSTSSRIAARRSSPPAPSPAPAAPA